MNPPFRFLALLAAGALLAGPSAAALFDHSEFDRMLHKYVDEDGYVDYAEWRENNESALQSYLERIAEADLGGWTREDRMAFWINAYNAQVIFYILEHPELKKISDRFAFLETPLHFAGARYTLHDVQFRILLNRANPDDQSKPIPLVSLDPPDPRVHFALVCGALGAPRLKNTAFTDDKMEDALRDAAAGFANDRKYLDVQDGRLRVSSVLKWYAKDFRKLGGPAAYLASLLNPDQRDDAMAVKAMLETQYPKAEFVYDWTVNDLKNKFKNAYPVAPAEPAPEQDEMGRPQAPLSLPRR